MPGYARGRVLGNRLIALAFGLDSCVHTPRHLFLGSLAFAGISSIPASVPSMLTSVQTRSPSLSCEAGVTRVHLSTVFAVTGDFLSGSRPVTALWPRPPLS